MDSNLIHKKLVDLKQKLSSINDDIVEIKKNQKINKKKNSFIEKEDFSNEKLSCKFNINEKLIEYQNKTLNNEHNLDTLTSNENLYNLNSDSVQESKVTPNKKIFYNKNFYDKLEDNKIKKKLEKNLTEENFSENIFETINNNQINDRFEYSNNMINLDGEISFRDQKNKSIKFINKLSKVLNPNRNPIIIRTNKRYNPYSLNILNQEINTKENKIKDLVHNKYNDNIMINNNNTICITCDNHTIQGEGNSIRKKVIPLTRRNNIRADVFNFYSIVSPKNKKLLNSKTIYFQTKTNKTRNKISNLSKDSELTRNETEGLIPFNKLKVIQNSPRQQNFTGKLLKAKKIIKSKNKLNSKEKMENQKKINFNNIQNKNKINSLSYNNFSLNGNTLINDRSNKLLSRIQNKISDISDNFNNNNINFEKEKLIKKINKQIIQNNKNHSSVQINKNLRGDSKREKKENENSSLNINDSKIINNFILKLIELYHKSTGHKINKKNDMNYTLAILYNWIENMNKKLYYENKKINEEFQYEILRQKMMNKYQLKNKNELKSFLIKILGED